MPGWYRVPESFFAVLAGLDGFVTGRGRLYRVDPTELGGVKKKTEIAESVGLDKKTLRKTAEFISFTIRSFCQAIWNS